MLGIIDLALEELLKTQQLHSTINDRVDFFKDFIGTTEFSRQDYMRHNKDISLATASRDLKNAVENGVLIKLGNKRLTKYKFK
jgi:Fic family protein